MPDAASLVSALLAACSVKLLDDLLDSGADDDLYAGRAVYCALTLCLGCLVRAAVAVPLFLACYAVGMVIAPVGGVRQTLLRFAEPSGAILVLVVSYGPTKATAALLLAVFAQLADDALDFTTDLASGQPSLAHRFGIVECALAALALLSAAAFLEPGLALCALSGAAAVWAGEHALKRIAGGGVNDR